MSDGLDTVGQDRRTSETTYDSSPLDLDGDNHADINGDATKSTLVQTIGVLAQRLTQDPQGDLFVFTTNHGGEDPAGSGKVRLWLWGTGDDQYIWDNDFVTLLNSIPARSITMTMEQCYSGGFVDDFMNGATGGQTRVISTAASATQPSYGNDFSFYWIDGLMGVANVAPTKDGDATLLSLREGFLYAQANDPSAPQYETPQYSGGSAADAGASLGLSSCSLCPIPGKVGASTAYPTDTDGDGIYEDLDGSGQFTPEDVVLFFNELDTMKGNQPPCAFDLNGNKRLDFGDVVMLYQEVQ
jgi:PKD repeat protein